jgi:hypothetical protein
VIGTETGKPSTVACTTLVPDVKEVKAVCETPEVVEPWDGLRLPLPEITANETGVPSATAFPGE